MLAFTFKDFDCKVHGNGNKITCLLSTSVIHYTNEVNISYKKITFKPFSYPEWGICFI